MREEPTSARKPTGGHRLITTISLSLRRTRRHLRDVMDRASIGGPLPPLGDVLRDAYADGWRQVPCAFALSTGRVGSKTVSALWAIHPDIHVVHESLPRLISPSAHAFQDRAANPAWEQVVYAARDDFVADAYRRGRLYAETNNRLTPLAPRIARCFPAARFLFVHRHPYAFVRSALRRRHYEGHHWDFARYTPRSDDPLLKEWSRLPAAAKSAWLWARVNAEAAAFIDDAPPGHGFTLASSDLFAADPKALETVFAVVDRPVPRHASVVNVLRARLNVEGQEPDAVPPAVDKGVQRLIDEIVHETARSLRYEL